jgi:cysteine desulfurase
MEWISKGDLLFGNPSSIHSSGKKSKRFINEVSNYLRTTFSLPESFKLFYHSGASEGINTIIKGIAQNSFADKKRIHFFLSESDHSCVFNLKEELKLFGHEVTYFSPDENGDLNVQELIETINSSSSETKLLNYTWVNNESGVCWNLNDALKIKEETGCLIHVDAVQSIGKIPNWNQLISKLDAYTFSGHKFGAMKGVGFTFIKEQIKFCSMVRGGGQQEGMRSGTENTTGIYSLKLAMEELHSKFNFEQLNESKLFIEKEIQSLDSKIIIAGKNAKERNGNTIYLIIPSKKADILITAFDLGMMDVSSGSACSSGAIKASRVLLSMGYSQEDSKSAVRLSFSHTLNMEEAKIFSEKINTIIKRFI